MTGKPYLIHDSPLVNQGLKDRDTLKLFFFPARWQGYLSRPPLPTPLLTTLRSSIVTFSNLAD